MCLTKNPDQEGLERIESSSLGLVWGGDIVRADDAL